LLADTLGLTLRAHAGGETGAALGAARLAWLACGGTVEAVCTTPPVTRSFEPDATAHAALALRHRRFQALYTALLPQFLAAH
jgi:xylulokinase